MHFLINRLQRRGQSVPLRVVDVNLDEAAVFYAIELLIGGGVTQTSAGLDVGAELDIVEI